MKQLGCICLISIFLSGCAHGLCNSRTDRSEPESLSYSDCKAEVRKEQKEYKKKQAAKAETEISAQQQSLNDAVRRGVESTKQ